MKTTRQRQVLTADAALWQSNERDPHGHRLQLVENFYKDNMTMDDPAAPPEIVTAGYARKAHILHEYLHRLTYHLSEDLSRVFRPFFQSFSKKSETLVADLSGGIFFFDGALSSALIHSGP